MDISLKYRIIEQIIQSEDENLLDTIKLLLDTPENDSWENLPEEIKAIIHQAETELDEGKGIPHTEVMKEVNDRFSKNVE